MKNLLIIAFMVFMSSCGTILKQDVSKWDDASAGYESVFTIVGNEANMGPAVYQINETNDSIRILTVLTGTYEVRSDSCSFQETGRYSGNEIVEFPLSKFHNSNSEKLCLVTIQINPELESTVTLFPRYSIVYLQFTGRELLSSSSYQFPSGFAAGQLVKMGQVDRYRLIQNCVNLEPRIIKESLTPTEVSVDFTELNQVGSSCYYSIAYSKDNKLGRHAFVVNIFNREHSPLEPSIQVDNSSVRVTSDSNTYLCSVGNNHKNRNRCQGKFNRLTDPYIIQVHTNKRSFYEMRFK
jgi:hypothetical protein